MCEGDHGSVNNIFKEVVCLHFYWRLQDWQRLRGGGCGGERWSRREGRGEGVLGTELFIFNSHELNFSDLGVCQVKRDEKDYLHKISAFTALLICQEELECFISRS